MVTEGEPRASLLRAELHRLRTRRLVLALVSLTLVTLLGIGGFLFTQHSIPSAADLAEARAAIEVDVAQSAVFYEQCVGDLPEGEAVEDFCGSPPVAEQFPLEFYLDAPPFELASDLAAGALSIGVAGAAVAFLVGATFVGAEWSQRTMVALLFWVPRRGKVVSAKLAVAAGAGLALGAALQLLWAGVGLALARFRGSTEVGEGFVEDTLAVDLRLVLLAGLAGLAGAALANLVRGTGAVLGVGFVYFAVVETAVRAINQPAQEWLLTTNVLALSQLEGATFFVSEEVVQPDGSIAFIGREVLVSGLQGGVVLAVAVGVVVARGTVLFLRRDIS